ncbi:Diphthamide biosynthesis protein 3 [Apophysomyces sp. BC1034]|nr:Diphthamide biosynthesis protein 3 [Apophysomyces sp. BC1015]KAG0181488.1 Diphthamide biosynthesis protein 3 [Apophysomyces sp. BC1021]KAG0191932.1 Diphthamide biosynthesis protein 3 [Apophysomyces sp. BC1034]
MTSFYDEIEIEDMEFDEDEEMYTYPCPCGDKFMIALEDLRDGEDVARCPSCSLIIRVIYDPDEFADEDDEGSSFQVDTAITVA